MSGNNIGGHVFRAATRNNPNWQHINLLCAMWCARCHDTNSKFDFFFFQKLTATINEGFCGRSFSSSRSRFCIVVLAWTLFCLENLIIIASYFSFGFWIWIRVCFVCWPEIKPEPKKINILWSFVCLSLGINILQHHRVTIGQREQRKKNPNRDCFRYGIELFQAFQTSIRNEARARISTTYMHMYEYVSIFPSKFQVQHFIHTCTNAMNSMSHIYIINNTALPLTSCGRRLPLYLPQNPSFAATCAKCANENKKHLWKRKI